MKFRLFLSVLGIALALAASSPASGSGGIDDRGRGGVGAGGVVGGPLCIADDIVTSWGGTCEAPLYWLVYDSTDTRLELWTTDKGAGADGMIAYVENGTDDWVFVGDLDVSGTATLTNSQFGINNAHYWGPVNANNGLMIFSQSTGQVMFGVGSNYGKQITLVDNANNSKDHDIAARTDPQWCAAGATDPDSVNTHNMCWFYDSASTEGTIVTGLGELSLEPAGGLVAVVGDMTISGGDLYPASATTDAAPTVLRTRAGHSWAQATGGNQTGAAYSVGPGIGSNVIVCDDRTISDQDVIVLYTNIGAGLVTTTLTESSEYNCDGEASEEVCCDNLGTAITTAAIGITPDCDTTAGTCYLTPSTAMIGLDMTITDSIAADGVFATLTEGAEGAMYLGRSWAIASDGELDYTGNDFATVRTAGTDGYLRICDATCSNNDDIVLLANGNSLSVRKYTSAALANINAQSIRNSDGVFTLGATDGSSSHGLGVGDVVTKAGVSVEFDDVTFYDANATIGNITAGADYDSPILIFNSNEFNTPNNYQCDAQMYLESTGGDPYLSIKVDDTCAAGAGTLTEILKVYDDSVQMFDSSGNGLYKHKQHFPATKTEPAAAGATPTVINTATFVYLLDANTEYLYVTANINDDWDATSDIVVIVHVALSGVETANDIINAEVVAEYHGDHDDLDTSPKTQTRTINHDIVNDNGQGDVHQLVFIIDYDLASNMVEVDDMMHLRFRLDVAGGAGQVAAVWYMGADLWYRTAKPKQETGGALPAEG